ncbi:hypothetical protein L6164_006385 [Bauhinia variegata]|uniref:Uncharacterized protein n=1 Tax=Bauhinia variegata TaxID=167791 RepID=A0ACB9PZP5_BAUVA|nr:hypothetical protein L6164_006385 [Bauhinia variegata]
MEWDFLGLSSKNNEEDAASSSKDSARGSRMQWPFSNRVSGVPQLLSFKAAQEDRTRKTMVDPVASQGYINVSTADAVDSNNNRTLLGAMQKNMIVAKQRGNRHGTTVYPMQHLGGHSAFPQEASMFGVSKQSNQMSRQVLQSSNLVSSDHHMLNSAIKTRHLGGLPPMTPVPVLPFRGSSSNVGTTDLRNSSKSSATGAPAQLTIFYGGSVNVYNDITPEKAQDLILLAGKGSNSSQNKTVSSSQVQAPISVPSKDNAFIMSQSYPTSLPSPLPGRGSSTNNELNIMTPAAFSVTRSNLLESPTPVGSSVVPQVPQARKKSLARFLEKRKDRLSSVSPYSTNMRPGSGRDCFFSLNSSGFFPLRAVD